MNMSVAIVSALIGFSITATILILVRRDHLHGSHAAWWIAVAMATFVIGLAPKAIDWLGEQFGIAYPPILAILIGLGFMVFHMLQMDIDRSRQERALRRLTQRVAILDEELGDARKQLAALASTPPSPIPETAPRKLAPVISLAKSNGES